MSDVSHFRSKKTYDGFDWTVKIMDTQKNYVGSGTDPDEATANEAAKTALKQKYLDAAQEVPDWLNG